MRVLIGASLIVGVEQPVGYEDRQVSLVSPDDSVVETDLATAVNQLTGNLRRVTDKVRPDVLLVYLPTALDSAAIIIGAVSGLAALGNVDWQDVRFVTSYEAGYAARLDYMEPAGFTRINVIKEEVKCKDDFERMLRSWVLTGQLPETL